jgi:molybdopterin-guanine dinucleotide biosynthesis protein A
MNLDVSLVIAAAGMGSRLNSDVPKAFTKFLSSNFLELLLTKSKEIFSDTVVVCHTSHFQLFENFRQQSDKNWRLVTQVPGKGSYYAVISALMNLKTQKAVICWVDQVGLDREIFELTHKNICFSGTDLAFPLVKVDKPYVQAILSSNKLLGWKFSSENDITKPGFTDCGIFGIDVFSYLKFLTLNTELEIFRSKVSGEVNFLSTLPYYQENHGSKIWEETNLNYTIAVNNMQELFTAENLLR